MQQHQADFRITCMARVLAVSRSGFYAWRQRAGQKAPSQLRRELCDSHVASAFVEHKGRLCQPDGIRTTSPLLRACPPSLGQITGEHPITAELVDSILSRKLDDLEPTLTRQ